MHIKVHESYRNVVALCDSDLIGKKFEEGKMQLDVRENFFRGEEVAEKEAAGILKEQMLEDATFNIVGEKSVNLAISVGLIAKNSIGKVQGIPFALILL